MTKRARFGYFLRKALVFLTLYLISCIVVDGIGLGVLWLRGYDVFHGDLPRGPIIDLIPSYSFIGYVLIYFIYIKYVAHEKFEDLKMSVNKKEIVKFLVGILVGVLLILIIVGGIVAFGAFKFAGFKKVSVLMTILTFGAVFVRATTIEIMCRGYLQNVLNRKMSVGAAMIVSAFAFLIPSIAPLIGLSIPVMIMAVYNLFLVSIMYSMIMVKFNSMWVSAGIHVGWNYFMAFVLDLPMAGTNYSGGLVNFEYISNDIILTGGRYGITASMVMTGVLLIIDLFLIRDVITKDDKKRMMFSAKA